MKDHYIDRSPEGNAAFKALPGNTRFGMLNMLNFREKANYPKGHPYANKGLTGAEAYAIYAEHTTEILKKINAKVWWAGTYECTLIGPPDEHWDAIFIVDYPGGDQFMQLMHDEDYLAIFAHRQAAIITSRLIRISPNGKDKNGDESVFPLK